VVKMELRALGMLGKYSTIAPPALLENLFKACIYCSQTLYKSFCCHNIHFIWTHSSICWNKKFYLQEESQDLCLNL
jgi:hypothetical protein